MFEESDLENLPLEVQYAYQLAIIFCDEDISVKVKEMRINAVRQLFSRMKAYSDRGYIEELLTKIFLKKSNYVLRAKTKKDIQKALGFSEPLIHGGMIMESTDGWHCDEEELIQWSMVSFNGPLNDEAMKRYELLARRVFPEKAETIFG